MFSGKSTELARRIRRHKVANRQCLVVKYAADTRYEDEAGRREGGTDGAATLKGCVVTHDRQALTAVPAKTLADVDNVAHAYDVIGIDEGQFFGDVVEYCEKWANEGKTVIVAALDGTFQRQAFNQVLGLVPLAEEVTKLSAVCTVCCEKAAFTKRIGSADTTVEIIGGADMYVATCRACFDVASIPAHSIPAVPVAAADATATPAAAAAGARGASSTTTPLRPPSSASSAERQRHKKRQSMEGASTPAAVATTSAATAAAAAVGASGSGGKGEVTPSLQRIGEQMRTLTMASPSTPAAFSGFGSPIPGGSAAASSGGGSSGGGRMAGKKAASMGAAAAAAAAGGLDNVMGGGGKRLARGAGGPGRSPFSDLERRGMGAVVRSPLANVR